MRADPVAVALAVKVKAVKLVTLATREPAGIPVPATAIPATSPVVSVTVTTGLPAIVTPAARVRSKPEAPDMPLMKVLSPDVICHLEEFTPAPVLRLASGRPYTLIVAKERAGERVPSGGVPRTKSRAETILRRFPEVLMER